MDDTNISGSGSTGERLPRRTVLKWLTAATAVMQLPDWSLAADTAAAPAAKGYGSDPDLSKFYQPGDFWPLSFTAEEKRTANALADLLFPADHLGPAASAVRVVDYLDEWVSAPYAAQKKDRETIVPGLVWLEAEAQKRFQRGFVALAEKEQCAIVDDICWAADAKPEFKKAAAFFQKFRALAASAYYATEPGWKALGYVGNVPLAAFDGPPPEVLDKLGVEQTVGKR